MRELFWLVLLMVLVFFWQLGGPALFDLDEGAFSAATWEMLQRGDYITPFLNAEPRFDKPILIYWLQAASVATFGLHEWALRLPSALAASVWVLATYQFVLAHLGVRQAQLAAVMLATSAMVVIVGRAATADAVLNLLIALTLFDIWRYGEHPGRLVLYRLFVWLGLGFLCKGPVAVMVPLLVSGLFFISQGRWRFWLQAVFSPVGWLLFLLVALPWYLLEYQAQGQAFIDGFFFKHNLGRFSETMEGHGGQVFYYLVALPLIVLPFTGLLPVLLRQGWRSWHDPLDRFLWVWFGFVLLFFSFSNTQLPHYVLYGITPLFILMGKYAAQQASRWVLVLPALLLASFLLFLPDVLQRLRIAENLLEPIQAAFDTRYRLLVLVWLLALLVLLFWRGLAAHRRLFGLGVLQVLFLVGVLVPAVSSVQQEPVRAAALFAREQLAGKVVVMDGINTPSFTVYRGAVTPRRPALPGEFVFSRVGRLPPGPAYRPVFRQTDVVIAERLE